MVQLSALELHVLIVKVIHSYQICRLLATTFLTDVVHVLQAHS